MSLSKLRSLDFGSNWMAIGAVSAAAIVNIYLVFLVVDANWGYSLGITAISPALRAASITVIGVILILQIITTKSLKLDFLVCVFLCYLFFGTVVGLIKNGTSYEFFRHLFAALTMLTAYWAGRFLIFEGPTIAKTLRFWAWMSVAAGGVAWLLAYRVITFYAFSMSPVSQFLPLTVGLTTGSITMFVLAFFMIAFGNKRDVILGAAAIFAVVFIRRYLAKMNVGLRIVAGAISTVIFALLIFLAVAQSHQLVAKLGFAPPVNLAERSNRVVDFLGQEVRGDEDPAATEKVGTTEGGAPAKNLDRNYGEILEEGAILEERLDAKKEAESGKIVEKEEERIVGEGPLYKKGAPFDENATPPNFDSIFWRLEKLTSSRLSLAVSVYNSVLESKYGFIFGKGFGGSYAWRYFSDNGNVWAEVILYQCDLMPLWFFLTSGSVLTLLLLGGIFSKLVGIFIYSTSKTVDVAALLVLGSAFGLLLSFQPNVPLFWLFLGAMSARMQRNNAE